MNALTGKLRHITVAFLSMSVAVVCLTGCQAGVNHTEPVKDRTVDSNVEPTRNTSEADTTVEIIIAETGAEELAPLQELEWSSVMHYPNTKTYILEGPASNNQPQGTEKLVESLTAAEWVLQNDSSTEDETDISYMSSHGRITIISNDTLTGVNLQYGNL